MNYAASHFATGSQFHRTAFQRSGQYIDISKSTCHFKWVTLMLRSMRLLGSGSGRDMLPSICFHGGLFDVLPLPLPERHVDQSTCHFMLVTLAPWLTCLLGSGSYIHILPSICFHGDLFDVLPLPPPKRHVDQSTHHFKWVTPVPWSTCLLGSGRGIISDGPAWKQIDGNISLTPAGAMANADFLSQEKRWKKNEISWKHI